MCSYKAANEEDKGKGGKMSIIQILFGNSIKTSITGYIVAVLTAILPVLQGNVWTWKDLLLPAIIAILGRFTQLNKDSAQVVDAGQGTVDTPTGKDNIGG